jgi:DNA-binding helix-hairpin-helix protein with protein kinase domain
LVQRIQGLGSEEARRISDLKVKQRDGQLKLFLERYYITNAKIKGIGSARKATLRSYGVETAADVVRFRIESISGFGPSIAGALIGWRTSIERRFIFDPKQPIDPAEIRAIKSDIARQQVDWVTKLGELYKRL